MMVRALILATLSLGLAACSAARATSVDRESCDRQAEGHYRNCMFPPYANMVERAESPRSDDNQACERSYHRALQRCAAYDAEPPPEVDLSKTSTGA